MVFSFTSFLDFFDLKFSKFITDFHDIYLLEVYRINVLVIDKTCKNLTLSNLRLYSFSSVSVQFQLVLVSAESYGQILSFGFGMGPKPERWFWSYTRDHKTCVHYRIDSKALVHL